MELVITVCGYVCAFIVAVFAHVVAHDACTESPRYARRILERALRRMPAAERARFEEEWLADLRERNGAIAKFRHATECLLCAGLLGRLCTASKRCSAQRKRSAQLDRISRTNMNREIFIALSYLSVMHDKHHKHDKDDKEPSMEQILQSIRKIISDDK
jgi:hypothetical protein